jgi:O-acetyl-ADP-ribose deacetylase (regulator of RNase III)
MIEHVKEDIFQVGKLDIHAIIHQANCHCTMGSGIAKFIRERFPKAYEADCKTVKGDLN